MDSMMKTLIDVRREIVKQVAKIEQMIALRACPFAIGDILVSKQPKRGLKVSKAGQKAIVRGVRFATYKPHYVLNMQWLNDAGTPIQGDFADAVFYEWEKA